MAKELKTNATQDYPHYTRGVVLALLTLLSWALIPILVKAVVQELSSESIAWFRLLFALIFFGEHELVYFFPGAGCRLLIRPTQGH